MGRCPTERPGQSAGAAGSAGGACQVHASGDDAMSEAEAVKARRAIEALRAGVPNRAAIRAAMEYLGAEERARNQDFLGRLRSCAQALGDGGAVEGVLLAGGFGAGKTHQLGYFRELAL